MSNQPAILITGGARRVGAALARGFHKAGYAIALHYNHSQQEAELLAQELDASLHQADLIAENAGRDLIREASASHPNLVGVINNASTFRRAHLSESSDAGLSHDLAINLLAPLAITREFAQQVGKGSVINILDTAIYSHHPAHFGYLVAKKALAEATQMAAREMAPKLRINAICPGQMLPTEGEDAEKFEPKGLIARNPAQRLAQVGELVQAAIMLMESKSYYGQILNIDAGERLLD